MSGKGSKQRPVDKKKFDENYKRIFSKKKLVKDLKRGRFLGDDWEGRV